MLALMPTIMGAIAPAVAGDIADCNQSTDPVRQIRGCSGFIDSGASGNNLAIAHANRGIAYDALGNTDRAIAEFDAALRVNPGYAVAYYNRGIAYSGLGDIVRAIADFDKAVALEASDPDAYNVRGIAHAELRNF